MLNFLIQIMAMTLTCKASGKHSSGQISLVCGTDLAYRNGFCSFRLANKQSVTVGSCFGALV